MLRQLRKKGHLSKMSMQEVSLRRKRGECAECSYGGNISYFPIFCYSGREKQLLSFELSLNIEKIMKILLIHKRHFLEGGAERAYLEMADVLVRAGHEVAFFSMKHPKNFPTYWEKYFVDTVDYQDETMNFSQKVRALKNIFWNRQAEHNMERLLSEFKPDVAHVHNIFHQISPSVFRPLKKHSIPIVMTLHDYKLISPNYYLFSNGSIWDPKKNVSWQCVKDRCVKDSMLKSLACVLERMFHQTLDAYGAVHVFLSPSHFLIKKFREYRFSKDIQYLSNPLIPFPDDYSSLSLDNNAPFVFIGRLSPEKGVETLIRAVALMEKKTTVQIVGDGPDRARLQELAIALGVESSVKFSGYLSGGELEEMRKGACALIVPSLWYENMPYSLVEALGRGKVVIGARRGGITERIKDGENGFLFDPTSPEDLAQKMMLAQHASRQRMGNAARKSVDDLREDIFLEKLLDFYRQAVG